MRGYSTRIQVYSEEPIETLGLIFRGPRPQRSVYRIIKQMDKDLSTASCQSSLRIGPRHHDVKAHSNQKVSVETWGLVCLLRP